jgi:anaerobic magnesium-protoporphyrin IX monomethyl ester cyclase
MKPLSPIKRILLIFPPSTSLASWEPMITSPMGILYLAAAAREAGYDVECLDAVVEAPYQETPVSKLVSRFGLTPDQILARIRAAQPDLVGLSCIFSNQWPATRELARRIKAEWPDLTVVSGGAHPSFMSERCMNDAPLDFIVRGEAEETFLTLLDRLSHEHSVQDIDGLVWRDGETVRQNPKTGFIHDLDRIPFPAHDLLDPERYFRLALPMGYQFLSPRALPVITSRGCPCHCTFCSSTNLWGNRYRYRSPDNVMAELDLLHQRHNLQEVKFQDDNLTINRTRAEQIFTAMAERPYRLTWNTPNGIAVWTLDEPLLALMKRSGCWGLTLAIESGDQEVMSNLIKKPLKLDKVREVNAACARLGIHRNAYFIIGFPGETRAQIQHTVDFARELKLNLCTMFIYNPLPGSPLFDESVRQGLITEESFFEAGNLYFSSSIDSPEWTGEELEKIIRSLWFRHYLGVLRHPYLVGRIWYGFFRYRPSFLKYFALRTYRTIELSLRTGAKAPPPA